MKNKEVSWAAKVFTEMTTFPGLFVTVVIVEFTVVIIHSISFCKYAHTPPADI